MLSNMIKNLRLSCLHATLNILEKLSINCSGDTVETSRFGSLAPKKLKGGAESVSSNTAFRANITDCDSANPVR